MKAINKKNIFLIAISSLVLAGCSSSEYSDLDQWMKDKEKTLKGKIEPLPAAKTFNPIAFSAEEDPFIKKPTLSMIDADKNKFAPDQDRRKDPLESYQLDALKMIGSLYKDGRYNAIIKTNEGIVHYVGLGNYLGNNYGRIIKITESQIVLDERIKEADEWKQKETSIYLDDGDTKR